MQVDLENSPALIFKFETPREQYEAQILNPLQAGWVQNQLTKILEEMTSLMHPDNITDSKVQHRLCYLRGQQEFIIFQLAASANAVETLKQSAE